MLSDDSLEQQPQQIVDVSTLPSSALVPVVEDVVVEALEEVEAVVPPTVSALIEEEGEALFLPAVTLTTTSPFFESIDVDDHVIIPLISTTLSSPPLSTSSPTTSSPPPPSPSVLVTEIDTTAIIDDSELSRTVSIVVAPLLPPTTTITTTIETTTPIVLPTTMSDDDITDLNLLPPILDNDNRSLNNMIVQSEEDGVTGGSQDITCITDIVPIVVESSTPVVRVPVLEPPISTDLFDLSSTILIPSIQPQEAATTSSSIATTTVPRLSSLSSSTVVTISSPPPPPSSLAAPRMRLRTSPRRISNINTTTPTPTPTLTTTTDALFDEVADLKMMTSSPPQQHSRIKSSARGRTSSVIDPSDTIVAAALERSAKRLRALSVDSPSTTTTTASSFKRPLVTTSISRVEAALANVDARTALARVDARRVAANEVSSASSLNHSTAALRREVSPRGRSLEILASRLAVDAANEFNPLVRSPGPNIPLRDQRASPLLSQSIFAQNLSADSLASPGVLFNSAAILVLDDSLERRRLEEEVSVSLLPSPPPPPPPPEVSVSPSLLHQHQQPEETPQVEMTPFPILSPLILPTSTATATTTINAPIIAPTVEESGLDEMVLMTRESAIVVIAAVPVPVIAAVSSPSLLAPLPLVSNTMLIVDNNNNSTSITSASTHVPVPVPSFTVPPPPPVTSRLVRLIGRRTSSLAAPVTKISIPTSLVPQSSMDVGLGRPLWGGGGGVLHPHAVQ